MAPDAVPPRRRGMRAGGFDQLATAQPSERHLHRTFRQPRSFGDRAQALRDRSPVLSLSRPVEVQIDEKGTRLLIVSDQIAHQNIQNIVVDRDTLAETRHSGDCKPLYRLKDSNFVA